MSGRHLRPAEQKKKEAAAQKGRDAERERAERKRRLEAGFQQVRSRPLWTSRPSGPPRGGARLNFADEKEVDRVLKAGSDYQVLQLEPGASAAEAKKRYRQMAIALHPDKCDVPRAGEAFHRVVTAYRSISSFL
ncbi:hypothetical protein QBZ16_002461 [Prototheca wickerhamii]|uniref:J domain-containing protein n=1 Tax=Prototheca wickerhamii TaxID=3111 RepID=A0AAD9IMF2_PROWI|nr:hypothetical protein QBZ16_002461 [Prototheca wickerhamii]